MQNLKKVFLYISLLLIVVCSFSTVSLGQPPFPPPGGGGPTANDLECSGCVDTGDLATEAVTSLEIQDGSIEGADINSTTTLDVDSLTTTGNVGIGTTSPGGRLHVFDGATSSNLIVESDATNATLFLDAGLNNDASIVLREQGSTFWRIGNDGSQSDRLIIANSPDLADAVMALDQDGNVGIGTTTLNYPLEMGSGAHVTVGGVWTNASSREYKENIRDLTIEEAKTTLEGLEPTKFNYKVNKEEEYIGFIAEDVPVLVASKDRKGLSPMDIVAVLTKVVQEQQKMVENQQKEIKVLKALLNERQ